MKRVPVHPSYKTIRLIQDKFQQKEYFAKNGLPVAPQMAIESGEARIASIEKAAKSFGFPFMVKGAKGSYDGRGNFKVRGPDDIKTIDAQMGDQPLYAEKFVPFQMELAVMVMRTEDDDGNLKDVYPYPVVETIHEDSICTKVYSHHLYSFLTHSSIFSRSSFHRVTLPRLSSSGLKRSPAT
jgi:phosphoribosylaminoimidazole carboxylase